jgi:hypothetical protein
MISPTRRYEIFRKLPSKSAVWVENATSLEDAQNRLKELARVSPADYFIFDCANARFIIPSQKAAHKERDVEQPDAGSRFAQPRSIPRFTFIAPVEITDSITKAQIQGRVTEISQHGCFVEVSKPLQLSSVVQLRIPRGDSAFHTWARVIYDRANVGFGFLFINTHSDQSKLLEIWLRGLEAG